MHDEDHVHVAMHVPDKRLAIAIAIYCFYTITIIVIACADIGGLDI